MRFTLSDGEILTPQDWTFPVPIAYGPGRFAELGRQASALGISRPLIVTDRGSRGLPFIAEAQRLLNNAAIFAEISPNPRDDEIEAGCAAFRQGAHDALIAIGGGSAMDGAKAIGLTVHSGHALWDFEFEQPVPEVSPPAFPRLITVPTTAGTGAETESTAMVTHTGEGMKFCVWHPAYKPSLALLDPALTLALPRHLTAWTGVDALTHAIEAYSVPGFHPLCDGLALEALHLIWQALPRAVAEPEDLAARGGMLVGSCLAGISFLKGLGMVHAISHMVGAEFDTQHGLTNAIVLPTVLRLNLPGLDAKTRRMGEAAGLEDVTPDGFIGAVEDLLDRLEIPKSLSEIGVPEESAPRIAAKALKDSAAGTNPRQASLAETEALVVQAISRAR